jgi:hypothetical protein
MESTEKNQKDGLGGFILLFILLLVQTGVFSVLIISGCSHVSVRLYTGFVGIGLSVFPIFVRKTYIESSSEKNTDEGSGALFSFRRWYARNSLSFNLIISLLIPWITWYMMQGQGFSFTDSVLPAAIQSLAAGALAFGIAGLLAFIKDFKTAGIGFNIFKIVIILSCLAYGMYLALPGIALFSNWLANVFHANTSLFINILNTDDFWIRIATVLLQNTLYWFISFCFCLYANIMIYKNAFIRS